MMVGTDHTLRTFAKRLHDTRRDRGWSQIELANRSGIYNQRISKIENGTARKVHIETLLALADALGVTTDYLLGRE